MALGESTDLRYYLYVSDAKVDMLFAQIPRAFLTGVSGELKVGLGVVSATLKQDAEPISKYEKLKTIVRYLDAQDQIGTVDDPKAYFRGELPMRWGSYGSSISETSPLVYFAGSTPLTEVGLGGSRHHVLGSRGRDREVGFDSASATPAMTRILTRGLAEDTAVKPEETFSVAGRPYTAATLLPIAIHNAILQMDRLGGPAQTLEFVARRLFLADSEGRRPRTLLGTPLFVAAAD